MTLTEEQRAAIKIAIRYIPCWPSACKERYAKEVLQAMIDSRDQFVDVTKLIERLAAGEHEQWAAWAQAILDSEPGLSDNRKAAWPGLIATQYENLSEEMKDKDRREVHLRSQAALDYIQQQSAEIERLRAENLELQVAVFGPDGIRANQACIIADQAARISDLEIEIAEPNADLEQSERVIEAQLDVIDQQAAKINELEAQLTITNVALENATRKPNVVYITGTGELGPDADAKPQVWQITEERKAALWHAIKVLKENDIMEEPEEHLWDEEVTVLQAMLTEAGQ